MKKIVFYISFLCFIFANTNIYSKENEKDFKDFIHYALSTPETFLGRVIAFKIQAHDSNEVHLYRTFVASLYDAFQEKKGWNKEEFIDFFSSVLINDEVYIVEEDMKSLFYKFPRELYSECEDLYNLEKEEFIAIIENANEQTNPIANRDCFVYKSLKKNILNVMVGLYYTIEKYPPIENNYTIKELSAEIDENEEDFIKLIHFILSNPDVADGKLLAFKIKDYDSDEVYLYSSHVSSLYEAFHQNKGWSKEQFIDYFSTLLINDDIFIVEHDMRSLFFDRDNLLFDRDNLLFEDCKDLFDYDLRVEYMMIIMDADLFTNPIYNYTCFIYKCLKRHIAPAFLDSKYFMINHRPLNRN